MFFEVYLSDCDDSPGCYRGSDLCEYCDLSYILVKNVSDSSIALRPRPEYPGKKTKTKVEPGEIVEVKSHRFVTPAGVTFFQLVNEKGWIHDRSSNASDPSLLSVLSFSKNYVLIQARNNHLTLFEQDDDQHRLVFKSPIADYRLVVFYLTGCCCIIFSDSIQGDVPLVLGRLNKEQFVDFLKNYVEISRKMLSSAKRSRSFDASECLYVWNFMFLE